MLCHGRLAASRPSASHLTEFYLLIAIGGVLGGIFNALLAPLIFNSVLEYPIAIVLACLLRPVANSKHGRKALALDFAMPAALFGLIVSAQWFLNWLDGKLPYDPDEPPFLFNLIQHSIGIGLPVLASLFFIRRPIYEITGREHREEH